MWKSKETCVLALHHGCQYTAGPLRRKISERHFHGEEDQDLVEKDEEEGWADNNNNNNNNVRIGMPGS